jgi:hypothetical protein
MGIKMQKWILIAGAVWSFQSPIYSMEISGFGVDSCASYVLALNEDRPTAAVSISGKKYLTEAGGYTQWVTGFVNAIRWVNTDVDIYSKGKKIKIRQLPADVNAIALSVKKICETKPDIALAVAVMEYVNSDSK